MQCEWNPVYGEPAWGSPFPNAGECPNEATVVLGAEVAWHLCASCAKLPRFRRFAVRRELERKGVKP